jgi:hypothetical protein
MTETTQSDPRVEDGSESYLQDYFDALKRLKTGNTRIVPKNSPITNDMVSLEAGRKKGSIKKSRVVFSGLIAQIESAATERHKRETKQQAQLDKKKGEAAYYRTAYEAALERELSLLYLVYELKKDLAKLTGERVIPIRGRNRAGDGDAGEEVPA